MNKNDYVFALDIGTRTVVGIILESTEDIYQIKAVEVLEHETRAMLDGQIHNVTRVAQEVDGVKSRLEKSCDIRLREV
ncbi:MAG: ATPase, partial [Halanaerobiales bacterium]